MEAARALRGLWFGPRHRGNSLSDSETRHTLPELPGIEIWGRSTPFGSDGVGYFDSVYRLAHSWSTVQGMSPRVAVSTAESGVGIVGRWAPRGRLGCGPRWGWCGG